MTKVIKQQFFLFIFTAVLALAMVGCGDESSTFSLLADSDTFQQSKSTINTKIDILWVIDNSGSMETSQQNVANNFQAFIQGFSTKNYDFQMAVTTTDAYRAIFTGNHTLSNFRDGTNQTSHTGVFVITPQTPNLHQTFITNMLQGVLGYGHERAFQSFRQALNDPDNAGFVRPDSFLAVIIVSDEDDFSTNSSLWIENYSDSSLHTIQYYIDYLDNLTGSSGAGRRYNVSAIAIFDEACRVELNNSFSGRKIGVRYEQLVDATGGVKGSLCSPNFATTLESIADNIFELATQFYLSRIPIPESIVVEVNDQIVPRYIDMITTPQGGFSYRAESNSIMFHGSYIPPQGASIHVTYDPVAYGQ